MTDRNPIYAPRGAVATSQPLATEAGLEMLRRGGSAVDAAIAAAAALTVVEPTSNGIGSDLMALIWEDGRLQGVIAGGAAPARLDPARLLAPGRSDRGWASVTAPAAPAGWRALSERYGRLPLDELLRPAADYAEHGFPLSPVVSHLWRMTARALAAEGTRAEMRAFADSFLPAGFEPQAGVWYRNLDQARTLRRLADSRMEALYGGDIGEAIARHASETGGDLALEDLAAVEVEWVAPLGVPVFGHQLWGLPPPTQGVVTLMAAAIVDRLGDDPDPVRLQHDGIEAIKQAYRAALAFIADGPEARAAALACLDPVQIAELAGRIGPEASEVELGRSIGAGTVYLSAADANGQMISLIQSNYMGFGAFVCPPGTGIALNNRAACFDPRPGHPNAPRAGARPYNTIIPGFLTREGAPLGPFGVMGGFMQPQGQLQFLLNLAVRGMDPQRALDMPRWRWLKGLEVAVEPRWTQAAMAALAARGHRLAVQAELSGFGRGQAVLRNPGGGYVAGSDSRADGLAQGC